MRDAVRCSRKEGVLTYIQVRFGHIGKISQRTWWTVGRFYGF